MSVLEATLSDEINSTTSSSDVEQDKSSMARNHPTYIAMPSPYFATFAITPSPSHRLEDPFASPLYSPPLTFYTAPSTPMQSPMVEDTVVLQVTSVEVHSPTIEPAVPNSPIHLTLHSPSQQFQSVISFPAASSPVASSPRALLSPHDMNQPVQSPSSDTDDTFPSQESLDMVLDDDDGMESLNPLEKIYLFSISKVAYHRVFICQDLPNLLPFLSPQDAVGYVLPLLHVLSKDQDDAVREALTSGLASVIWWFMTHCEMTEEETDSSDPPMSNPVISVEAFTAILGRLILSASTTVSTNTKSVIVNLLERIREADRAERDDLRTAENRPSLVPTQSAGDIHGVGLFGKEQRSSFEREILDRLIVGLDNLQDTEPPTPYECLNDEESDIDISNWRDSVKIEDDSQQADVIIPEDPPKREPSAPYFPINVPHSPILPPSGGSPGTPTNSTTISSFTPSEGDNSTIAAPTPRLTPSPHVVHFQRPVSPSFIALARTSPTSSPLHQIGDPFASLHFEQRPSSPGGQVTWTHDTQASALQPITGLSDEIRSSVEGGHFVPDLAVPSEGDQEQVAAKRMTSLNLMAIVTAQGCVGPSSQIRFVQEIERLSFDPVPLVRRESSFAIGALAKTVPDEVVHMSLLPLMENLLRDSVPLVRHSSIFALPSVLSRLPLKQRQEFALYAVKTLATDSSAEVRSGVLECLGEVIHAFHTEGSGVSDPPGELLDMFLGQQRTEEPLFDRDKAENWRAFYQDPCRPLVCAFNFPAVVKTLGRSKWDSTLRLTYLRLANNPMSGIRRILAASVGDTAKILGSEIAERDLMGVWRDAVNGQDEVVRTKTVDSLNVLFHALGKGGRLEVLQTILEVWKAGRWKGWRERETIVLTMKTIIDSLRTCQDVNVSSQSAAVCGLVIHALADNAHAVREAAVNSLPSLWILLQDQPQNLLRIRLDLKLFAQSTLSRRRMTYVSCLHALLQTPGHMKPLISLNDDLCEPLRTLAQDSVVGVRIGVARLTGDLCSYQSGRERDPALAELVKMFSHETSREVLSYTSDTSTSVQSPRRESRREASSAVFSRPPLLA